MNITSAMAAARANARHRQIVKEKERIISAFASDPHTKHRATVKVVKMILLNGPYLLQGRLREIEAKSLGAGVYELSTKIVNE